MNIAVIGSGPCGAVAALKLLRAGHNVTMLDIGHNLNMEDQLNSDLKNLPSKSVNSQLRISKNLLLVFKLFFASDYEDSNSSEKAGF